MNRDLDLNTVTQFAQSLALSLLLMQQLENAMLEETRAIEMRDTDLLRRILDDKQDLIARIETETCRQKQWAEGAQCAFTPAGMMQFFAASECPDAVRNQWSMLRESAARCDRMNQFNARLIDRHRKRIATSLRILSGDDGVSATYNPRGRTESTGPRSRTRIQA